MSTSEFLIGEKIATVLIEKVRNSTGAMRQSGQKR